MTQGRIAGADTREANASPVVRAAAAATALIAGPGWAGALGTPAAWKEHLSMPDNLAPCFGLQFFGHVAIDGATEVMTVTLRDVEDRALWATRIEPKAGRLRLSRAPAD